LVGYGYGDGSDSDDKQVFYNKEFVNKFFQFHTFEEASNFTAIWFKELKHNPTEFTSDWPAILDKGCSYREELL
jgi:hypothetical protein